MRAIVIVLVTIGIIAAIGRAVFIDDLATRFQDLRGQPANVTRRAEVQRFDRQFSEHRTTTLLHVAPGALYLLLAPLQFSRSLRSRHVRLHRWSGRFLIVNGVVIGVSGLYFGVFDPFAGPGEAVIIAAVGLLLLTALGRAWVAIRRRDVAQHREWMIRAFALCLGISTVRIVSPVLDLALTPLGASLQVVFVLSLWLGWGLTLGSAEMLIRRTRQPGVAHEAVSVPA